MNQTYVCLCCCCCVFVCENVCCWLRTYILECMCRVSVVVRSSNEGVEHL